jgi:hypothetical protein
MSDAAAAVKGTSNNKHEKAHHNSMAERHECPPLNDLSRNRERRTTFLGAEPTSGVQQCTSEAGRRQSASQIFIFGLFAIASRK